MSYTRYDINPLPRWSFSRYAKDKKDKKKSIIRFNTPIQPTGSGKIFNMPDGFSIGKPLAKRKINQRYV
jgi:hypothetical protein